MYLLSPLHGHGTSACPSASGAPSECRHGTKAPVPSVSRTSEPVRVITPMLTTTYGESVIWTPMCAMGDPTGPMLNGITYIVRPFIEPAKRPSSFAFISSGSYQLLLGTGVLLSGGADEGAVFDASDVGRVGPDQVAVGTFGITEFAGRARVEHQPDQLILFGAGTVAPVNRVGLAEGFDLANPFVQRFIVAHDTHDCVPRFRVLSQVRVGCAKLPGSGRTGRIEGRVV